MAEQEEPVYFDRNRDAALSALLGDLRRDLFSLGHLGETFPEALPDLSRIADLAGAKVEDAIRERRANRERPVQIAPRTRPDLVAYFDRRYDVYREDRTLSNVALSSNATGWTYLSGRNVYVDAKRIVSIVEHGEPADVAKVVS